MINLFNTSGILGDWLVNTLNGIGLFLDWILYSFISLMYQVFIAISQVNLFGESTLRLIIDRVFTVLGIAMLFIMAYEIILLIINPDKLTGENGAKRLVTKVITSIVLIVLLPTVFKYMQIFQYNVITSNVIGNIVLGGSTTTNVGEDISKAGANMALTLATTFFHPVENGIEYTYTACLDQAGSIDVCNTYIEVYEKCLENSDPGALFMNDKLQGLLNLNAWESFWNQDRKMKYIPVISTLAAILALKMIVSFCIDIGIRVAKLGFLQVSAPLPIAMNITEKNSIFETKWFKSLKDTYLDIFLKLIIIYFAMFAITLVPEVISNMWATSGNFLVQGLATVAVILGILQFAKDGPKLIKELFNMDLDISISKKLGENEYLQRGIGMARSGVYSAANEGNFFGGAWRGRNSYEQGRSRTDALLEAEKYKSTPGSRFTERLRRGVGLPTSLQSLDDDINKEYNDGIEKINKDRADYHIKDRMEYNKEALNYRSEIMSKSDDVGGKVDTAFRYGGDFSYYSEVSKTNVSLKDKKLSELNEMYQYAVNAGESAEVLQQFKEVIDTAKKDVRSQVINKAISASKDSRMIDDEGNVIDKDTGTKLISANDYRDIKSNINQLNAMVKDKKVAQDEKGIAKVVNEMSSASDIIKDLNTEISIQNEAINKVESALARQKAQLDRTKEEKTQAESYKRTQADDKFLSNEKKNK